MNYLSAFCPVQIFVAAQRDTARHLIEQAGVEQSRPGWRNRINTADPLISIIAHGD
jgi:hypothetical protein